MMFKLKATIVESPQTKRRLKLQYAFTQKVQHFYKVG